MGESKRALFPVSLAPDSELTYACEAWNLRWKRRTVGVIHFFGFYRRGSSGANDALFIAQKCREFCDLRDPVWLTGLVVDFRRLDYVWGDDLDVPRLFIRRDAPILVVVEPEARPDFAYAVDADMLRTDYDEALAEAEARVLAMPPREPPRGSA